MSHQKEFYRHVCERNKKAASLTKFDNIFFVSNFQHNCRIFSQRTFKTLTLSTRVGGGISNKNREKNTIEICIIKFFDFPFYCALFEVPIVRNR